MQSNYNTNLLGNMLNREGDVAQERVGPERFRDSLGIQNGRQCRPQAKVCASARSLANRNQGEK